MLRYALYQYVPQRCLGRAPFELQDLHRVILAFKDGRNVYTRWAARRFAYALSGMDMRDVAIACVPASTAYADARRWKRFSHMLCTMTRAMDAYPHVHVAGSRTRAHVTGEHALAANIKHYVTIDLDWFRGRKVVVIDDIITTGQSSEAFIALLKASGAQVMMALFLAKTTGFTKVP